jgi:hypothetical protein
MADVVQHERSIQTFLTDSQRILRGAVRPVSDMRRVTRLRVRLTAVVLAASISSCAEHVQPAAAPVSTLPMADLWEYPVDIAHQDLFYGVWGASSAPDPKAIYRFVERKQEGTNPGMTVQDPLGREWHVKQPPHNDQGAEGPIEVTLSRVLSAVGYHQPPEHFVPSFLVSDAHGTHREPGGRFRLTEPSLRRLGTWSWRENPFVGRQPYQGLIVILMMFNSSDIKDGNNALYEVTSSDRDVRRWYVVHDLGTALGETGRLAPRRGDPDIFEQQRFIIGVAGPFVTFNYHGRHQELVERISADDVRWASNLLGELSGQQWRDAFRAGGYDPAVANRFIARIQQKIAEGRLTRETPIPLRW